MSIWEKGQRVWVRFEDSPGTVESCDDCSVRVRVDSDDTVVSCAFAQVTRLDQAWVLEPARVHATTYRYTPRVAS